MPDFDNTFEVQLALAKDALEKAGIPFQYTNDNYRSLKPMPGVVAGPIAIEIRVPEQNRKEAIGILESIQAK